MDKTIGATVQTLAASGKLPLEVFQPPSKTGLTYQQNEDVQRDYLKKYLNSFGQFAPAQVREFVNSLAEKDIPLYFAHYMQHHDIASVDKAGNFRVEHIQQRPSQTYISFVVYFDKVQKKIERVSLIDGNTARCFALIKDAFFYIASPTNVIKIVVLDGGVAKMEQVDSLPNRLAKDDVWLVMDENGSFANCVAGYEICKHFLNTLKGHGFQIKSVTGSDVYTFTYTALYNRALLDPHMAMTFRPSFVRLEHLTMNLTLRLDLSTDTPTYWIDPATTYVVPCITSDHNQMPIMTYFHTARGEKVEFCSFSSSHFTGNTHFGMVRETNPKEEYAEENYSMPITEKTAFQHTNEKYRGRDLWTFPDTPAVNGYLPDAPLVGRRQPVVLTLTLPDKPTEADQMYRLHVYDPAGFLVALRHIDLMVINVHCLFREEKGDAWRHTWRHKVFFGIDPATKHAIHLPIYHPAEADPPDWMPASMATKVYNI